MSVTKTEEISPDTRRLEVSLKRAEAKITVNLRTGEGLTFVPGTWRVGNVPASTFVTEHVKGSDAGAPWDAGGMEMDSYWLSELIPVRGRRYYYVLPSGEPEIGKKNDNSRLSRLQCGEEGV